MDGGNSHLQLPEKYRGGNFTKTIYKRWTADRKNKTTTILMSAFTKKAIHRKDIIAGGKVKA